jgi:hypothetical protein
MAFGAIDGRSYKIPYRTEIIAQFRLSCNYESMYEFLAHVGEWVQFGIITAFKNSSVTRLRL